MLSGPPTPTSSWLPWSLQQASLLRRDDNTWDHSHAAVSSLSRLPTDVSPRRYHVSRPADPAEASATWLQRIPWHTPSHD